MKLNLRNRVALQIGALLVVLIGVFAIVVGVQFQLIDLQTSFFSTTRLIILLVGILLIVYGVYVLLLPKRLRKEQEHFIVQQTANGELRISMKAIENIVKKCVDANGDMRMVEMNVNHARNGVRVDLRIALPGNISIPLVVESLQKQIKKQIQAAAGIDEVDVRVSVETAEQSASHSTYQIEDPEPIISQQVPFDDAQKEAATPPLDMKLDLGENERPADTGGLQEMENDAEENLRKEG
jgi:uncharacterized alkaline shock family protein YloU